MRSFKSGLLTSLMLGNLALVSPTYASIAPQPSSDNSFLTQFFQTYNSLKTSIEKYSQDFSKSWETVIQEAESLINGTNGELGAPDPVTAGERIRNAIEESEDSTVVPTIETPPEIVGQNAEREWHQKYTIGQSQSILGESGQSIQKQEAEMSNNALSTSNDTADAAQEDVITQDILKKIAIQNTQAAIINKSLHSEAQKQTRALATANINLADISSRMDEQAKEQERQTRAAVSGAIGSSAAIDVFWANQ
jgi:hypothetical protein